MRALLTLFLALILFCQSAGAAGSAQPLAGAPLDEAALRAQVVAVALTQQGVREELVAAKYRNSGAQVEAYLKAIGLGKGYAWCAAFVVWCCRTAGIPVPRFGMAHAFFTPKTKIWPGVAGAPEPQPGDLLGFRFVRQDVDHVALLIKWGSGPTCDNIQGNTSGRKADRDGQGVYRKWTLKSQIYQVANLFKTFKH